MSSTFLIRKAYALSAIDKAGKRVYYDTDAHSGGYPYWSWVFNQYKTFDSLDKVPVFGPKDYMDYMRNDVTCIEVLEVKVQAKVVSSTELVSEAKAKAMAEIDKIQKELALKIASLEEMK
jgi:hypothetical protein